MAGVFVCRAGLPNGLHVHDANCIELFLLAGCCVIITITILRQRLVTSNA